MKNIKLMNKIAAVGTDIFDRAEYTVDAELPLESADALMVRSAALHDVELPARVLAIARCGAGVNNIPVEKCAEQSVVVFNTPGANANGVKELTVCALALASRDIAGGIEWASSLEGDVAAQVEKGKSAFGGVEFSGKTLGVIGLGAIGGQVANTALNLGMKVLGYDPYLTVDAAWNLSGGIGHAKTLDEIFEAADYITLHVPAVAANKGMINAASIAKMKDGVRIINLARADLAVAADVKAALASGKVASYVTDFPTAETVGVKGIVNIPHLGASTEESEDNCAVMAARQLDAYLKTGNIRNSVNYPTVEMPMGAGTRICVLHANIPAVIANISGVLSDRGINIENLTNKSKGDNAYTLVETTGALDAAVAATVKSEIEALEGIHRVRVI